MGTSRKATMKMAAKIEGTPGSYQAPDVLLPLTSQDVNQEWESIADNSIVGVAFKDLPAQGVRSIKGPLEVAADLDTMPCLLQAAFGDVNTGVYTLPTDKNEKSLSFCRLDGVKTNKYFGCFVNNFNFKSSAKEDAKINMDILGYRAEGRDDTAFPSTSIEQVTRILHQHAFSTNGYVRLGDQSNALVTVTDDLEVKEIGFGVNWNFDLDFFNSQESLIPLSGAAGIPEASFNLTVNRHSTDNFKTWYGAHTALQAEIKYYVSATKYLLIQVPNIKISEPPKLSGDEVPSVELKFFVGRNGMGTSYSNANMAFVSPIKATIVNS